MKTQLRPKQQAELDEFCKTLLAMVEEIAPEHLPEFRADIEKIYAQSGVAFDQRLKRIKEDRAGKIRLAQ